MLTFLRRHALALSIALCLISGVAAFTVPRLAPATAQRQSEKAVTVYVARTGEKYHRGSCHHLRRSMYEMSLAEAKRQGYEACKVCRPAR